MELGLRGKIGLVTGGSRGIGRGIALGLADEGCAVAVCGRTEETLKRATEEIKQRSVPAHYVIADVTQPGEAARFVAESAAALGGVDLLVCNVGGGRGGRLLTSKDDDWRYTFEVNVVHSVSAVRAAVPHMEQRGGGSVVIIGSINAVRPTRGGAYGAAKAAEMFIAAALARDLGPQRIRVNTLSPGGVFVPGNYWDRLQQSDPDKLRGFAEKNLPWGRVATVEEIADVAVYLLSERARWINGANIPVDGAQGDPT